MNSYSEKARVLSLAPSKWISHRENHSQQGTNSKFLICIAVKNTCMVLNIKCWFSHSGVVQLSLQDVNISCREMILSFILGFEWECECCRDLITWDNVWLILIDMSCFMLNSSTNSLRFKCKISLRNFQFIKLYKKLCF